MTDLSPHPGSFGPPFLGHTAAGQAQQGTFSLFPGSSQHKNNFFFFFFFEAGLWWTKRQEMVHPFSRSQKVSMQVPAKVWQVETEQLASGPTTLASGHSLFISLGWATC